jgi:hypothetical protein
LFACVREVCRLWAQPLFDTFHQLVFWSAVVSVRSSGGWQTVLARREINAGRRVIRTPSWNAPAELGVRTAVCACALSWSSTTIIPRHAFCSAWPYAVFFSVSQAMHFWRYCGPLLHECLHQHSFPVLEISCHPSAFWQTA